MNWLIVVLGCHLGHPPAAMPALAVGEVRLATVEPGLGDDLRSGLAGALARRGALGGDPSSAIGADVLDASTSITATGGGGTQVHSARLEVRFQVGGAFPRQIVLQGERVFGFATAGAGAGVGMDQARADAFAALARELCDDAAAWFLLAPTAEAPLP